MPNGFLKRIRMGNIYRPERIYEPIDEGQIDRTRPIGVGGESRIADIGRQISQQIPQRQPMDVIYKPPAFEPGTEILRQSFARTSPEFELEKKKIEAQYGYKGRQLDIQQQRADVYSFKAQNPNMRVIIGKDGITRAIDPLTGQMQELGRTGMSDEEALRLNQQYGIERIEKRGEIQKDIQETRGEQALAQIRERGAVAGERELLPTQQAQAAQNRYNILINKRPELRQFVTLDANGMPIIEPPGVSRFMGRPTGPTPEQFEEMNRIIFPEAKPTTKGTTKVETETEPMYKTQRNTRTGETRKVMSTDGGKTWVPAPVGK